MNDKLFFYFSTLSGFLVVALGAFGAHALSDVLIERRLQTYQTAVLYQMFHTLALLGYLLSSRFLNLPSRLPAWSFSLGICIFSGSLYLLAITQLRWLGAITPLGGLLFLVGWISWFFQLRGGLIRR